MKRLNFVFLSAIVVLILCSCQKENHAPPEAFSAPEQRVYAGEENDGPHNPKVKDIDVLVSSLTPIFAEYGANSLFKDVLSQAVIETTSGDDMYYCFPIEEYHNVTYKVLTKFNQAKEMVELGIIRIGYNGRFLEEFYDARAGLEDFKGVITSYDFDQFMSNRRNELEDCAKIVFCDENNSGGTTGIDPNPGNDDGSVGNDDGGFKNTGVIFINDGSTSGGTILVAQTRCGCAPSHIGGRSNSSCSCRKPDIVVFVPIIHTLKKDTEIHTRDDYFDCIDMLLSVGLISDVEILAKRLKDCDLATEPYDVEGGNVDCGPGASTDDSDQNNDTTYPDTEFCMEWLAYRNACLDANTETNDAWGHFMLHHNGLFTSVIADPSTCVSTEEMEEKICVKNAVDLFDTNNNLNLTKAEKKAIEAGASCGPEFVKEAAEILIELMNNNDFFESPSLQDFQDDQDNTYLAQLQKAVIALKEAGVDWYADFVQELIDCEEFETVGDLRDTWYMVKDFISEYNQFLICQREQEVAEWMLAIFSPENVGIILGYYNFAPNMSVGYRAAFRVRFAQTAKTLCSNLDEGFDTFVAFKETYGTAGTGKAWHHIVEQNQIQNSGFNAKMVHHPDNLIIIEHGAGSWHSRINSAYTANGYFPLVTGPNQSLRQWLVGKPFELQYEWGLKVMELTK